MKPKNWFESLNCAIEGIIYVVKTQKHMRYHYIVAVLVLFLCLLLNLSKTEFIFVSILVALVLIVEMINTALEVTIDLISDSFHPLAKIVKDISAGAVLIASFVAVVIGYLILYPHIYNPILNGITFVKRSSEDITVVSLITVLVLVLISKAYWGKGEPLHGGMPSGHAALSFAIWIAIAFATQNVLIILLAFVLAVMVSHSRLLLGVHRITEVVLGAVLGILVSILIFQLFSR